MIHLHKVRSPTVVVLVMIAFIHSHIIDSSTSKADEEWSVICYLGSGLCGRRDGRGKEED